MVPRISILFVFFSVVALNVCTELPDYIKACKVDSKLNECARTNALEALPFIFKGDKSLKLSSLVPYNLPEITINAGNNLKLTFKNCVLSGLEHMRIDTADIDLDGKRITFTGNHPHVTLVADYKMEGRILVFPITGSGKSNITMDNTAFNYTLNYDLVKDGNVEYIRTKRSTLTIDPAATYYDFENLFNGDPVLGPEMNKFLNENQKDVGKDLNPAIGDVISSVITHILLVLIEKVPYNDIFLF